MLQSFARSISSAKSLAFAAIASASLLIAAPAHAQMGMMGGPEIGELTRPAATARAFKNYARLLSLTPEQKRAADDLLASYQNDFRDATSRLYEIFQSVSEDVQQTGDWESTQNVYADAMLKFVRRTEKLNTSIMEDFKALLDPRQVELFPSVERAHRRQSALKMGLEGIQRLDLFDIVDGLRLDQGAVSGATAHLDQYSVDFDREIVAREKLFRGMVEDFAKDLEAGKEPKEDSEKMMSSLKEITAISKRMGDINAKYAGLVRAALPENKQTDFDAAINLEKYPMVYRKSFPIRLFEAADKLPDLDAGQKEALKGIRETYVREAQAANQKWASAIDDVRNKAGDEMMFGGMWQVAQDPAVQEAKKARTELDKRTADAAMALLNDAQKKKMPNPKRRPEFDFDAPRDQ